MLSSSRVALLRFIFFNPIALYKPTWYTLYQYIFCIHLIHHFIYRLRRLLTGNKLPTLILAVVIDDRFYETFDTIASYSNVEVYTKNNTN